MWFISILATCVLIAAGQQVSVKTPPFDLVGETLPVDYGNIPLSPPGRVLPLSVPVEAPRIGVPTGAVSGNPYLLIMVDPDSPRPYVLHWLQLNLIRSSTSNVTSLIPLNNSPPLTTYRNPRPPAGDGPHRYTLLLFNQPANFTIPPEFASYVGPESQRRSFDFPRFVAETGLEKPVAGNYFFAENSTAINSTASGSSNATSLATGAIPGATVLPFTGGAGTSYIAFPLAILSGLSAVMIAGLS